MHERREWTDLGDTKVVNRWDFVSSERQFSVLERVDRRRRLRNELRCKFYHCSIAV